MKAIMYHYVRPDVAREPDYYHLSASDFQRQLDYFESEFGFVDREEFVTAIRTDGSAAPPGVVLTFDDGFRDHYETVFRELQKRDLWGIFYVPTGPYVNGNLLDVHRTHVLLGRYTGAEIVNELSNIVTEEMIPFKRRAEFQEETYRSQKDDSTVKQAKRILNYFIAPAHRTAVLDQLDERLDNEPTPVDEFYVSVDELREMQEGGMLIGSHTVSHPVLSKLRAERQQSEIRGSFSFLSERVGEASIRSFCYPYGGAYSFDNDTKKILEASGCAFAFNVESRDIDQTDLDDHRLELPRYDCTDFPHGESSGSLS